jgi:hypothetical protein
VTRLARRPCFWPGIVGSLLFAIVAVSAAYAMQRSTVFVSFSLLIAAGALVNMLFVWREARRGVPIVEIDRPTLGYGDSAELRVMSCGDVDVRLVGECQATKAVVISNFRDKQVSMTRCYDEELIRGKAPFTVRLHIPKSAPAEDVAWKIVVEAAGVAHPYPLRVS